MSNKKSYFTILLTLFLSTLHSYAQVTIGSSFEPNYGTILDIKEKNTTDAGVNSTRGLMLPRVQLTGNNLDALGVFLDSRSYIGMIIYNVDMVDDVCPGVQIWDGTRWVQLSPNPEIEKEIMTSPDGDGNVYKAKWFGIEGNCELDGDYWMTSNLYATKDRDGNTLGGVRFNPGRMMPYITLVVNDLSDLTSSTEKVIYHLGDTQTTLVEYNESYIEFVKKIGFHYREDQSQATCPRGWHLPSELEWDRLIKVHDPDAGASNKAGIKMYEGVKRIRFRQVTETTAPLFIWGAALSSPEKYMGFSAYPAGLINTQSGRVTNIGVAAHWWMDRSQNPGSTINSVYTLTDGGVEIFKGRFTAESFAIRCVKDK